MKTFQKNGRWVEKMARTEVLECLCGRRYIRTREGQKTCIKCLVKHLGLK